MGKKTESKISLSLKDLERLGVIKKRLKRKRRVKTPSGVLTSSLGRDKGNKRLNKVLEAVIGGVKSDSSHLQKGYTNQFQNTSNLTTEGHRLQNQLLGEAHVKNRNELEHNRLEDEIYKKQIHNALGTLYDAYTTSKPYYSNYMIEELPDENEEPPNRFTDLRNKQQFYSTNDNIDVPRTDGSEFQFKGEPIMQESVAQQSLDALKKIDSAIEVGGGGLSGSPRTPKSDRSSESKQNSIFNMFSGLRSTPNYQDEKIFPTDQQRISPVREQTQENPMLKQTKPRGVSPRFNNLQMLKEEAIKLGIPEEDVALETRQDAVKKLITRHKAEERKQDEIKALVAYYTEISSKLSEPINTYLLDSPSPTLLKSAIKKLKTTAKKRNIDIN